MSPAQDTVLSAPELFELVLTHLPMRDLLVSAPRVRKTWRALTLAPTLQRILFRPDPSASVQKSRPTQNPLLVELFPPFFIPDLEAQERWDWPDATAIRAMPWANPTRFGAGRRTGGRCHSRRGDSQRRGVLRIDDLEGGLHMGVLYDLVVPLVDREESSFCIRWQCDTDIEKGEEADLTLTVSFTAMCIQGRPGEFRDDRQFYCEGVEAFEIEFENWELE
ncbi:hypothetical protein B0H19DRAFT_1104883 [Mycena capillaripes]|nr:hypothetical protein B0H19DRAFT_1104883 [Mycena capillaripes]